MRHPPRGHAAIWLVTTVALVFALVLLPPALRGELHGWDAVVFAAALVAALGGIVIEHRHDRWDVAAFGLAAGTVVAIIATIIARTSVTPETATTIIAGVAAVVAGASGAALFRMARSKETVPNVLGERFGKDRLLETGGVQVAVVGPAAIAAGEVGAIEVFVQNCFDAERTIAIRLDAGACGRRLAYDPRPERTLAPLEVGVLTIPVRLRAGPAGVAELVLSISAAGAGGTRVRRSRARTATRKASPVLQVLAALAGVIVTGGGIELKIRLADVADGTPTPPLPEAGWEVLWRPDGRAPLEVARAAGLVRGATRR